MLVSKIVNVQWFSTDFDICSMKFCDSRWILMIFEGILLFRCVPMIFDEIQWFSTDFDESQRSSMISADFDDFRWNSMNCRRFSMIFRWTSTIFNGFQRFVDGCWWFFEDFNALKNASPRIYLLTHIYLNSVNLVVRLHGPWLLVKVIIRVILLTIILLTSLTHP